MSRYGPQGPWFVGVLVASLGYALTPVFIRWLGVGGMDAPTIAFYRYAIPAVLLFPFLALGVGNFGLTALGIGVGALLGLGWIGYIQVLEATSVATAGILYLSFPIFTVVFSWALLGIRPGLKGIAVALAVVAAAYIAFRDAPFSSLNIPAVLMVVAAPASFGLAITVLAGWLGGLSPIRRLACVPFGATVGLAPFVLADAPLIDLVPTNEVLPLILGLGLGTALLPQFLYVISAPRIGPFRTAVAGSVELPCMVLLGLWLFDENPTPSEMLACALLVCASLLVAVSRQPKGQPPAI